jgi:hypothetical protein
MFRGVGVPQGLKPKSFFGFSGTTEVVPCYKAKHSPGMKLNSFFGFTGTTEVGPCYKGMHPSGAEAQFISSALLARLKSCPVTKPAFSGLKASGVIVGDFQRP